MKRKHQLFDIYQLFSKELNRRVPDTFPYSLIEVVPRRNFSDKIYFPGEQIA